MSVRKLRGRVVVFLAIMTAISLHGQTLSVSRPPRTPRSAGEAAPPPPPPSGAMLITTSALGGGIQAAVYPSTTLLTDNGFGPFTWSVISGSLPPGLTLSPVSGSISGTPSAEGTSSFTVQVADSFGRLATKTLSLVVSGNSSTYGNTGDPYATEGGAANPAAIVLNSCPGASWLDSNTSYRLGQNLTAATPGTVCINLNGGVKLDLAGFTISGRISLNASGSGISVFNGTINCNWVENGSDAGCLRIASETVPAATMKLHHLTIHNDAAPGRALHIDWAMPGKAPGVSVRVYNVTIAVPAQPSVLRSFALSIIGTNHTPEFLNNDITCSGDAAACQAIMCYSVADCKMHHNKITMLTNTTVETGRGLLLDGNTLTGEVWNNQITANNNRAIRIRDSYNIRIHDNNIKNITLNASGSIHLADPDGAAVNDLNVLVDSNDFELAGGTIIFMRNGFNAALRNNRFTCVGTCNASKLALARSPINGGNRSELTLENNQNVILFAAPAQVNVESNAKVNLCNSGQASGSGTVVPTC